MLNDLNDSSPSFYAEYNEIGFPLLVFVDPLNGTGDEWTATITDLVYLLGPNDF